MKKLLLPIYAVTFILSACNTEKKNSLETENRIVFTDTSLLKSANGTTDVAANKIEAPVVVAEKAQPKVQVRTITRVVHVRDKQPSPKVIEKIEPPVVVVPTATTIPSSTTTGTATNTGTATGVGNVGSTTASKPIETKKKNEGWSSAAKGATIGGVGGAVAGAVLGKGSRGAIIGGVIGAAGGYILGRKADKKSGSAPGRFAAPWPGRQSPVRR